MGLRTFMTTDLITLSIDDDLNKAKSLFENSNIHHLLVIDDDEVLVGVINDRDLYKHLSPTVGTKNESYKDTAQLNKKVHQIMTRNPITETSDIPLSDAVLKFHEHHISCLPIVDDEYRAIGILTWRDIIKILAVQYNKQKSKVKN